VAPMFKIGIHVFHLWTVFFLPLQAVLILFFAFKVGFYIFELHREFTKSGGIQ
jgi:hypothetical protein